MYNTSPDWITKKKNFIVLSFSEQIIPYEKLPLFSNP